MDSTTDIRYILDTNWSKAIALGIAEGICEVFGGNVRENPEETAHVEVAQGFEEELTGEYKAKVSDLKLRAGANTKYKVIDTIPRGGSVHCYGYYTKDPVGNAAALTITPLAGGARPVSAHLVIVRIQ